MHHAENYINNIFFFADANQASNIFAYALPVQQEGINTVRSYWFLSDNINVIQMLYFEVYLLNFD